MISEKFIANFIDFVDSHFDREEHEYVLVTSPKYQFGLNKAHGVQFLYRDEDIFTTLVEKMYRADKIILHGLWREKVNLILQQHPSLLNKSFWMMWGGDFYFPDKTTESQKFVIKNVAYLVNYSEGEIDYVRQHYGAQGTHVRSFGYPSNFIKTEVPISRESNNTRILVGNSATQTNQHLATFDIISSANTDALTIITPLSYGDFKYGMQVMKAGYEKFGEKYQPLIDFLSENEYLKFLEDIDIAVFNHNRQQGMGNILTLLGMGKKVYMNEHVSTYKMFKSLGIMIFKMSEFSTEKISEKDRTNNIKILKDEFSQQALATQLNTIFSFECKET